MIRLEASTFLKMNDIIKNVSFQFIVTCSSIRRQLHPRSHVSKSNLLKCANCKAVTLLAPCLYSPHSVMLTRSAVLCWPTVIHYLNWMLCNTRHASGNGYCRSEAFVLNPNYCGLRTRALCVGLLFGSWCVLAFRVCDLAHLTDPAMVISYWYSVDRSFNGE